MEFGVGKVAQFNQGFQAGQFFKVSLAGVGVTVVVMASVYVSGVALTLGV